MSIFKKNAQPAPAVNTAPATENGGDTETDLDEVMRKYDRESATRVWEGTPKIIITVIMSVFSLYCLYMTLFSTALPEVRLTLFVGCIIILGFLTYPAKKGHVRVNSMPWYDIALMVIGSACFFYFAANALPIIKLATRIQTVHVVIGVIGILVLVELCRRCVGIPILCVVAALLVYTFYNQLSYNPSFFNALKNVVYKLFYTTSGVIGTPINVCFTYIVLFIIFGAFLERTGIANFFISLANRLAGWSSGGPAKVAVISSALCGMVSGSSVGNTVTTGSVTIPMMKKTGYKPEFAGAVEAAASTGGQIMPPIMGAAAFLMAEYMDLPYAEVAVKAILPAVLYFSGIFIAVHLEAKKLGLKGIARADLPKWSFLLKNFYLILPLVLLVWLVSSGAKTMAFSAALSILAAFIIGFIHQLLEKNKEMSFGKALGETVKASIISAIDALMAGAKGAITVAVACAMAGMIAGCITVTGLASILINAIVSVAGNATIIGLVLTMLCCIVLGMGVPTTANYCIMAATCAPIMMQLGVPMVAAHFFVFYFGIVADITPPVALAAYAGSAIAKSRPMPTAVNASKLAIAAFVVPYVFAFYPVLLGQGVALPLVVFNTATAMLGLMSVAACLNGYIFGHLNPLFRIVLAVAGVLLIIPTFVTDGIGAAAMVAVLLLQWMLNRKKGGGGSQEPQEAQPAV